MEATEKRTRTPEQKEARLKRDRERRAREEPAPVTVDDINAVMEQRIKDTLVSAEVVQQAEETTALFERVHKTIAEIPVLVEAVAPVETIAAPPVPPKPSPVRSRAVYEPQKARSVAQSENWHREHVGPGQPAVRGVIEHVVGDAFVLNVGVLNGEGRSIPLSRHSIELLVRAGNAMLEKHPARKNGT